jgi:hypothetical protein
MNEACPEPSPADRKRLQSADRMGALVTSAPKWITLAIVAWQLRLTIEVLAGKNLGSLLERFGRQTTLWELLCWAAGLAGVLFGVYSRIVLHRERSRIPTRR